MALARLTTSPALRCRSASSGEGCAGENATDDCRMGSTPHPGPPRRCRRVRPGGGPRHQRLRRRTGRRARRRGPSSGGGGGAGGGAVTVTVAGLGGSGVGGGAAGLAATGGGAGGRRAPAGLGTGRAAGSEGAAADDAGHHGAVAFAVGQPAVRQPHHVIAAGKQRREPRIRGDAGVDDPTVTPAPVEYCQACATLSIALPGAGWATSGSAITTGFDTRHVLAHLLARPGRPVRRQRARIDHRRGDGQRGRRGEHLGAQQRRRAQRAAASCRSRISDT